MIVDRIRPIRSENDYLASLERIETLMDAEPDSAEGDELAILATLVERYEEERFPIEAPTPLAAIQFRMEQLGLTPQTLIPHIGSRSRVSEVLNGTRALTIDMIRALHQQLGIPAHVLIGSDENTRSHATQEFSKPVAKVLEKLGLLKPSETFGQFWSRAFNGAPTPTMLRKTTTARTNARTDLTALQAWCASVRLKSDSVAVQGDFDQDAFDSSVLRAIAKLSVQQDGPRAAQVELSRRGVALLALEHFPGTHLDGAVMRRSDGVPVIALTLRRNRIDNFWFTLLHECAHLALHMHDADNVIVDDLEINSSEVVEREADVEAQRALIPSGMWRADKMGKFASSADIHAIARAAEVDPAIVAGRWQKQNNDYRKFSRLLGHGKVELDDHI
jgi:HTH-type transcriptional regulator / antitoxin HigA